MGTNWFGWCLTGHHDQCPSPHHERECGCPCHKKDVEVNE